VASYGLPSAFALESVHHVFLRSNLHTGSQSGYATRKESVLHVRSRQAGILRSPISLCPIALGEPRELGCLKWRGESWRCLVDLDGLWSARLRYYVSHLWK
jgi:hypothetical protein